jgi:hypothetical protein
MTAYREAVVVDSGSSNERVAVAANELSSGTGVVLLEGTVALRSLGTHVLCDVIDPIPATRKCENEFGVLVENAQRLLEASRLGALLPRLPCRWRVVEDRGAGAVELWRAP